MPVYEKVDKGGKYIRSIKKHVGPNKPAESERMTVVFPGVAAVKNSPE